MVKCGCAVAVLLGSHQSVRVAAEVDLTEEILAECGMRATSSLGCTWFIATWDVACLNSILCFKEI